MKINEFTSYCGDTYEKRERESGHVEYHRIKKANCPEWTPKPRLLTTEEVMSQLRAERDRYKAALDRVAEHLKLPCDKRDDGVLEQIVEESEPPC